MRTLILMRGSPGCGKSTWILEHGLEPYALSADAIRSMFASYELSSDGKPCISQRNDKIVWETLFQMLERRMQRGDFTIIDACNSKTAELNRYKQLAGQYRYRIYCVDMTDIPIDEVLRRNAQRDPSKVVPEEYIRRVYSRFETQQIPSGVKRIRPEDFDSIYMKPIDLSQYDRVVHIGDIHGCYDALQKMFGDNPSSGIDPNTAYVFLGDYGDCGPDTPGVLKFLMEIAALPNVCLLEGNHEAHLWAWANDKKSRSRDFELRTKFELETAGILKPEVRSLYRRFRQCSYYVWRGKSVLCTHGGVPSLNCFEHVIDFVPSFQMIKGVGQYEDADSCISSFANQITIDFQVFGHRNVSKVPANHDARSFVLEGDVEHGGALRVATLDESGWSFEEYTSDAAIAAMPKEADVNTVAADNQDALSALVDQMRRSPLINEKKFGHISSFNFTRAAFADKQWNDLTTRARGLYIDTTNMKITARGYEKFFAVNERNETSLHELSRSMAFPVEVFVKENGFLGLASWDAATDSLFVTTKSSPDGEMAKLFKYMLSDDLVARMSDYLREHDVTLLFEVVHPELDPHIIEYDAPQLFLLDAVKNTLNFDCCGYDELVSIAHGFGVDAKKRTHVLQIWDEFMALYQSTMTTLSSGVRPFEGYVLRDANGYMLKLKTDYYTMWKSLRAVADKVYNRGHIRYTSQLTTPLMNYFYAFVKEYYSEHKEHMDIITLRWLYERSKFNNERKEGGS